MKNYFKKFSVMLIMLLAVLGIGIIKNGTMANAATIGQQLTVPESGWQRYSYNSKEISYEGTGWWFENDNCHVYVQKYQTTGAKIKFNFTGTKLRILAGYWWSFTNDADIIIDGKIVDKYIVHHNDINVVAPILVYEKLGLNDGEHSVEIKNNTPEYLPINSIDIQGKLLPYSPDIEKESISLDKSSMNLTVGDSQQLTATTTPAAVEVTWKSSDSSIATVDSTGKVTGVKEGTCTITATTADGLTATCTVTVTPKTAEPTNPDPDPTDSENIVNIAHAKGDNTNNAGGDVTIIFHGSADTTLSVVKTADVKDVWVGDNFTYTIVVANTGTKTAKAVVVNDPAPNHIDFLVNGVTSTQGKIDPSSTSKNIIVNVGDIAPGAIVTIKIPATVIA
ncbi:putative repeat protein (TIGR01451 family) [Clostridium beijerinckii]|uniref:Ig-like domain-containing protein n=1 Tax=Clostridium beijerinckii TaxID=1520 RepID=UPI00156F8DB0|nr:Ig-like domain-containing protein [Clostridium beijerinckii]NRT34149.1 putative repeat protein (TIGR01451 family) [Clostridium beijerinckii]NRT46422.1 putative repeat protein (TIGR01451 family) [Clostridium beijerinckii]NRZ19574.1 putative repeat protein (TIGR01451 family) [Clostridium beijerinckii]